MTFFFLFYKDCDWSMSQISQNIMPPKCYSRAVNIKKLVGAFEYRESGRPTWLCLVRMNDFYHQWLKLWGGRKVILTHFWKRWVWGINSSKFWVLLCPLRVCMWCDTNIVNSNERRSTPSNMFGTTSKTVSPWKVRLVTSRLSYL